MVVLIFSSMNLLEDLVSWAQFMGILQDPYRFQHSNSPNGPKKKEIIQIAIQNNISISFK